MSGVRIAARTALRARGRFTDTRIVAFTANAGSVTTAGLGTVMVTTGPDGSWDTLHDAPVVVANRVHSIVDREVPTDQVRAHGGVFPRQCLGAKMPICLIFAVVDRDDTSVPGGGAVGSIMGMWPVPPITKSCGTRLVWGP